MVGGGEAGQTVSTTGGTGQAIQTRGEAGQETKWPNLVRQGENLPKLRVVENLLVQTPSSKWKLCDYVYTTNNWHYSFCSGTMSVRSVVVGNQSKMHDAFWCHSRSVTATDIKKTNLDPPDLNLYPCDLKNWNELEYVKIKHRATFQMNVFNEVRNIRQNALWSLKALVTLYWGFPPPPTPTCLCD